MKKYTLPLLLFCCSLWHDSIVMITMVAGQRRNDNNNSNNVNLNVNSRKRRSRTKKTTPIPALSLNNNGDNGHRNNGDYNYESSNLDELMSPAKRRFAKAKHIENFEKGESLNEIISRFLAESETKSRGGTELQQAAREIQNISSNNSGKGGGKLKGKKKAKKSECKKQQQQPSSSKGKSSKKKKSSSKRRKLQSLSNKRTSKGKSSSSGSSKGSKGKGKGKTKLSSKGKGSNRNDCDTTLSPSSYPSSHPSVAQFNITNCPSYQNTWMTDLESSCIQGDNGDEIYCQCNDAQRRIDNGQIECGADLCPDDCDVCKFCLYYVVDCHSHTPSSIPTIVPTKLASDVPSVYPTKLLSKSPSTYPSHHPSAFESSKPTVLSSAPPSVSHSDSPTVQLSMTPSVYSSNNEPSFLSSVHPSNEPVLLPIDLPSLDPSSQPSTESSLLPSVLPSLNTSSQPSLLPSVLPSLDPSFQPSLAFDITDCGSYALTWLLDLQDSCTRLDNGEEINCQCHDAQRRVDNGQIECPTDQCPFDCPVCITCLYYVVECHSHMPSILPSNEPSYLPSHAPSVQPTIVVPSSKPLKLSSDAPSVQPTIVSSNNPTLSELLSNIPSELSSNAPSELSSNTPSLRPTMISSINPTISELPSHEPSGTPTSSVAPTNEPSLIPFDISNCQSFSNYWLLDLTSDSCNAASGDYTNCECLDAQARIDSGQIQCGVDFCPEDCNVCEICLYYILDCPTTIVIS